MISWWFSSVLPNQML